MKFHIDDDFDSELSSDRRRMERGIEYYNKKKYRLIDMDYENQMLNFVVSGSEEYRVSLNFSERGEIFEGECTCPAFGIYDGCCKHILAVSLAAKDLEVDRFKFSSPRIRVEKSNQIEDKRYKQQSEERNKLLFRELSQVGGKIMKTPARVELSIFREQFYSSTVFSIELRIGDEKIYKVAAMSSFPLPPR